MEIKTASNNFPSLRGPEIEKSPSTTAAKTSSTPPLEEHKRVEKAEFERISENQLNKTIEKLNNFLADKASGLEFSVDEDTGRSIVKLIDKQTNEILRQYPSKEMLEISKDLSKLQGLLISTKI